MNYYVRYFDSETLVHTPEEVIDFLASLPDIEMTQQMADEIMEYASNDVGYPKRYKVRPRLYFIIIKTLAETMQDFKEKKALRQNDDPSSPGYQEQMRLKAKRCGWYEGEMDFKRVIVMPNGKCEYRDTVFVARCIADSAIDCYNRIAKHLMERIDQRSQLPSPKGEKFKYTFLGAAR